MRGTGRHYEAIITAKRIGAGLYKSSKMRHTFASLYWRIFYHAMFDHNLDTNNRRE